MFPPSRRELRTAIAIFFWCAPCKNDATTLRTCREKHFILSNLCDISAAVHGVYGA